MQPYRPASAQLPPGARHRPLVSADLAQAGAVREWITEETANNARSHDIQLVAGELVANALTHSLSPEPTGLVGEVVLWQSPHHVEVRVTNHTSRVKAIPLPRLVEPDSESGRGLLIVAALADAWGWRYDGARITVWARFNRCGGAR